MDYETEPRDVLSCSCQLTEDCSNADGACTTECDSGDCAAEVEQEILPVVKQEPDDVSVLLGRTKSRQEPSGAVRNRQEPRKLHE